MLVAIGDTHATTDHRLTEAALAAVREATVVVHTGDFTRAPVLDALEAEAGELVAVAGNNDEPAIQRRLDETAVVDALGRRFVVTHGHQQDDTAQSLLARQEGADVVVVGHSHRPTIRKLGEVTVLNPGSYADPRWNQPAFAVVERRGVDAGGGDATGEREGGDLVARLVRPDGSVIERATL